MDKESQFLLKLMAIGAAIGIGQLLASKEPITVRLVFGRMLVTSGLAAASSLVLVVVPEASETVRYGAAAGLASLGTSGLEMLLQRVVSR